MQQNIQRQNIQKKIQEKINSLLKIPVKKFKKRKLQDITEEEILFTKDSTEAQVSKWNPTFYTSSTSEKINLKIHQVSKLKGGHQFILESNYTLQEILHNSFTELLKNIKFSHTFTFNWPDSEFFNQSAGLKISSFTKIKETRTGEDWELHLRAKKDKSVVLGFLLKPAEIQRVIDDKAMSLLKSRKLPLILDLDDTLIRVVDKTGSNKVFPVAQLDSVKNRTRDLKDGRKVVLASRVLEFLKWAKGFFEISICSLGDLDYVNQVVKVLDPNNSLIKGVVYSARDEYLYLNSKQNSNDKVRVAPKDIRSLFAYSEKCSQFLLEPIIVDDIVNMWIPQQRDLVINVREVKNSSVWDVNFFPVVTHALEEIYKAFFHKYDAWCLDNHREIPSTGTCYKEFLRRDMSFRIGTGPKSG